MKIIKILAWIGCIFYGSQSSVVFSQYQIPPADKTVPAGSAYTMWLSLDPEQCVSDEELKTYLDSIVFAITVLNSEDLAQQFLEELAEKERCTKVVGRTLAALSWHKPNEPVSELVSYESWVNTEELNNDVLMSEFEASISNPENIALAPIPLNPFFCLTVVTAKQTNWRTGSWQDKHRLICTIPAVGVIKTRWKARRIEQKNSVDVQRAYNLNFWAPAGGAITHLSPYNLTSNFVLLPDAKLSQYSIQITIPPSQGGGVKQAASFSKRPVNRMGRAYPRLKSQGRKEVWFPDAPPKMNPRSQRANNFDATCRNYYQAQGYPYPNPQNPGLVAYQNHHVRPVRWAGNNTGKNCYRLTSGAHHWFTMWWNPAGNFRTPVSQ